MIINGIDTKDISVVFQGPVNNDLLQKGIDSVTKHLPNAEIIISTWENTNLAVTGYDQVVFNKDPGVSYDDPNFTRPFNINRWIVSSSNGVKLATRKYVLKCRSDSEIINTGFLRYWNEYSNRDDSFLQAKHKIIIPSPYTLRHLGDGKKFPIIETPFHVSDWYCFGLREDILDFVSCPLIKNLKQFARYYANKTYYIPYTRMWWCKNWLRRMAPEQYIGLQYAKRLFPQIDIENVFSFKNFDLAFAERFLLSNYIVLDPPEYGVINNKFKYFSQNIYILGNDFWQGMYRNAIYEKRYKKILKGKKLKKIDYLNIKHNVKHFIEPAFKFLRAVKRKSITGFFDFVKRHEKLYISALALCSISFGLRFYKKLEALFSKNSEILVCPFRGTGDSYIVGNYLKEHRKCNDVALVVPRKVNKSILELFGCNHVYVATERELNSVQSFARVFQPKNLRIFHYAPNKLNNHIGYNLAGFKGLNFADFYDYIVFGESRQTFYKRIENKESVDFVKEYGVKKGKTILLAPYSDSIPSLPNNEWELLAKELLSMGYEVFTNCSPIEQPIKNTRPVNVPFEQLVPFLDFCGYFVSIRSGLCDIACTSQCKKIILHPKWIKYNYGKYLDFFTLNIPERKIFATEFEYDCSGNKQLVKKVIKEIEGVK